MHALPNVTLIKVPCSGFIRPSWLEFALRNGADGAFVCGCPLGDCFNRLGNNLIQDRVVQMRRRLERQKMHPDRVATIYHGLHEQAQFVQAVREFSERVAKLPAPPPAPARRPPTGEAPSQPAATGSGMGEEPAGPAAGEGTAAPGRGEP
jgi:F420-non-reducing hydrogenase iron-sulfur subunit